MTIKMWHGYDEKTEKQLFKIFPDNLSVYVEGKSWTFEGTLDEFLEGYDKPVIVYPDVIDQYQVYITHKNSFGQQ